MIKNNFHFVSIPHPRTLPVAVTSFFSILFIENSFSRPLAASSYRLHGVDGCSKVAQFSVPMLLSRFDVVKFFVTNATRRTRSTEKCGEWWRDNEGKLKLLVFCRSRDVENERKKFSRKILAGSEITGKWRK